MTAKRVKVKLTEILKGTLLLVLLGGLAVHQVVETSAALHEVVETTHDAEDTEREDPDTDHGDNAGAAVLNEPTEDGEESGKNVDDEDSTGKLPRGDGRPEGTVGTGDEDEPVLSERDLEEENLINVTEVLDDTTVVRVGVHGGEGNPGADSQDNTEKDRHTPELGQVPLDGALGVGSIVVGNSQGGDISENGDEDNQLDVERLVEDSDPETKEDFHVQGKSDTVDNVGVHAVENLAGGLEGINDSTETRGKEDNIGGRASSVGGALDSNTSIGLLQRGSIVDTVTSHGNKVTTLLKNLDDVVLVLGEDLGETIGSLNEIVDLRTGHVTTATETEALSVVDVGSETELTGSLTGNTDGVTSKHLDRETQALGFVDGAGSVVTGRVRAGHDTENLPSTLTTLAGNTKRAETTGSELGDTVLVGTVNLLRDGVVLLDSLENEERSSLDTDDALALGGLHDGLDLLGDGVERLEVKDLVLGEDALGTGVELERLEESLVDSIDTLLLAGSGQASSKHQIIGLNTGDSEGLSERELVLGQGTGLVGAQNLDTSKGLDGRKLLDNSLLLGEVGSTDGHGGGDDSGKTDGDTDNGDGQGESENVDNAVGSVERGNPDDEECEDDKNKQNCANAVQDLSEVAGSTRRLGDQSSGTTDEGVVTGSSDNHESLSTLDSGRSIAVVALVLIDSQRLTSDGRLINLDEATLGDEATIGRDDGTLLNLKNITGDNLRGLNLLKGTVTEDNGLQGQCLLELINNGSLYLC